jgi:thioredoxin 1
MSTKCLPIIAILAFLTPFFVISVSPAISADVKEIPVKGMATMVDLGAKTCIPCKMMAPILERMQKQYSGKAAIIFIDVNEKPRVAARFSIFGIPTQIFFDQTGREVYRHSGFMSEEAIIAQLASMGVL